MNSGIDTVLFDLDGTLLDTAADMAAALNAVLRNHARPTLAAAKIRAHVSRGGMALVRLGFGEIGADLDDESAQKYYDELLAQYAKKLCVHTRPFDGVRELLAEINRRGKAYAIVTNKPTFLTEPLLELVRLTPPPGCVVCGDSLSRRKPFPDQLLYACQRLGSTPKRAVYIGDDARDIEAGQRAGMRTLAAAYGYIIPEDDATQWGADAVVQSVGEIADWLAKN